MGRVDFRKNLRASLFNDDLSNGFDPSIRRHSGIRGAADEAVLNTVRKNPPKIFNKKEAPQRLNGTWKKELMLGLEKQPNY
jgi:hypothetical protein